MARESQTARRLRGLVENSSYTIHQTSYIKHHTPFAILRYRGQNRPCWSSNAGSSTNANTNTNALALGGSLRHLGRARIRCPDKSEMKRDRDRTELWQASKHTNNAAKPMRARLKKSASRWGRSTETNQTPHIFYFARGASPNIHIYTRKSTWTQRMHDT